MNTLRIVSSVFLVVALAAGANPVLPSDGLRLVVEWNVPVTEPEGGHFNWYELKADPEDGNNLIVCGAVRNAQDNAYYGTVYSSGDGGRSWRKVLEDKSSTWVSEQSCAFGRSHTAYFVSEASAVADGRLRHSLGTTRIFVSRDGGEHWAETAKTGWADYSSSVVGLSPGSTARKLYVFYNGNSKHNAKDLGSTLEFLTVSEDGKLVDGRHKVPGMAERNYQGVYPSSSLMLNDGTPVVLFNGRQKSSPATGLALLDLGIVRVTAGGPTPPIVIATHAARDEPPICPFTISNTLAYDATRNALHVAYNDATPGYCAVMLTTSRDGGLTWSRPRELHVAGQSHSAMYFPVLTVNQEGVLGLLWRGRPEGCPDCWFFSTSRDGVELDYTIPLSRCAVTASLNDQSSAYLTTVVAPARAGQPTSLDLLTFRDYLTRVGIAATADGAFHPIWSTLGDGRGELRTARVRIGDRSRPVGAVPDDAPALVDVTDKIKVLYGGTQRLDHETNSVMLDLSLRNIGPDPIHGPLLLKVESATSDFGKIELATPSLALGANYVDVSTVLHDGSLAPEEKSSTYQLAFHFLKEDSALLRRYFLLRLKLRFFCPCSSDPAKKADSKVVQKGGSGS